MNSRRLMGFSYAFRRREDVQPTDTRTACSRVAAWPVAGWPAAMLAPFSPFSFCRPVQKLRLANRYPSNRQLELASYSKRGTALANVAARNLSAHI